MANMLNFVLFVPMSTSIPYPAIGSRQSKVGTQPEDAERAAREKLVKAMNSLLDL